MKAFFIISGILFFTIFNEKSIPVVDFKGFEPFLNKQNDTTYVVNFWATWCKPCVKELTYFEQINQNYKDKKVKVILASLDFYKNYQNTLIPFVKNRGIKSDVLLIHDPNFNNWIDKVDKSWSGAIPATLVYTKSSRSFYEKSFTYSQLDSVLNLKLSNNH
jgi:thiol-disulfide isomerase/thioredoxin